MSDQLLPCPFCGGMQPEYHQWGSASVWVECGDCGASGEQFEGDCDAAAAAWNRRPSPWRRHPEEKPADGQICLAFKFGERLIVRYDAEQGGQFVASGGLCFGGAYWVPLPGPPEGEGR